MIGLERKRDTKAEPGAFGLHRGLSTQSIALVENFKANDGIFNAFARESHGFQYNGVNA